MPQDQSPWDDVGAGFWRSGAEPAGGANGNGRDRGGRPAGRSARAADSGWDEPGGRRARDDGRPRRGSRDAKAAGKNGRGGRFSNTADDLRNRLGIRGSVVSRDRSGRSQSDEDFWAGSAGRKPGRSAAGEGVHRARGGRGGQPDWDGGQTQAWQDPEVGPGGYRGSRRAGGATAGIDEGGRRGRTAVRDRGRAADELGWEAEGGQGGRAGLRSRVDERRGGGRGGGGGRDGRDGGRGGNDAGPPLSRGQRFKRWLLYGRWWRHWTWKKAIAVLGGCAAFFILLCIGGFFLLYSMTPIRSAADQMAVWQSSNVYFANGQLLGTIANNGDSRELLTASQIPNVMTQAMTAAEDRGFYTEGGISVSGLARSAVEDLFGSGGTQGGSTITMQYAKNYYSNVGFTRNATTKIKEIFVAIKLAHARSKQWIMTNYLNTIPFGNTEYGLGAAAEAYFNVNLANPHATLTIAQAAMLAAMPNEPGVFNPNPDAGTGYNLLVARWKYVLRNMVRDGNITQQQASAQAFPKITPAPVTNGFTGYKAYLMQMVEQELETPATYGGMALTEHQLDTEGLKITTTFSMAKVNALARSVGQEKAQMAADGLPFQRYDRIGAVLENPKTGAIIAVYGGPGWGSKHCNATSCQLNMAEIPEPVGSSFKPYVLSTAVNEYMNVFTSQLNGYAPIWIPTKSDDASRTEMALSPTSPPPGVSGSATGGYSSNGIYYYKFPGAAETGFDKPLPVNVAAAMSSDPAFEDLTHRDGIQNVINMAGSLGVGQSPFLTAPACSYRGDTIQAMLEACNDLTGQDSLNAQFSPTHFSEKFDALGLPGSPQIALGEAPLTPVEQATTFATLADDGLYHTPHVIQQVQQGSKDLPLNISTNQVLSKGAAADVDWALSFDNNSGEGTAEGNVSFRRGGVIAKTGTLGTGNDSSEAWFIGATPDQDALSIALFTNLPHTQTLNNLPYAGGTPGSQGGGWPATIWNNFMTTEFGSQSFLPVNQVFPTVNGYPFTAWMQATPAKKAPPRTCRPGQFRNCIPGCQGNGRQCGNPNPTPSCGPFGVGQQQCNPNPTPTPTCGQFGQGPCGSPSPMPTPSPSCTFPPGPCSSSPPGAATDQTASALGSLSVGATVAEDKTTLAVGGLAVLMAGGG
jgi:membrane peptidoglycan carboxypeptidase